MLSRAMLRILVICIALPNLAYAEGFKHRIRDPSVPLPKPIEVYCTDANGDRRELGDVICINASCLTWMAKCDMSLNNPMWRKIQDGCPAVLLDPTLLDRIRKLGPTNMSLKS